MLRFYLKTAWNVAAGMSTALALFVVVRCILWLFGAVPFVILVGKTPLILAVIAATSLFCSAIWTGAQWIQGRTFSN